MPANSFTPEQIAFIKANRLVMSATDMAAQFGCDKNKVSKYMRQNGLSAPRQIQIFFRVKKQQHKTNSSPEIDALLQTEYLKVPVKTLANLVNKSDTFVKTRLRQLNLTIPSEIVEQRKKDSRIKKGTIPPNKGKKQVEYMTEEAISRTMATRFSLGQLPSNTKADNDITLRIDNRGVLYYWIRIAHAKWIPYHLHLWLKSGKQLEPKHVLRFKDGDTLNCQISNIEMISMAKHLALNRNGKLKGGCKRSATKLKAKSKKLRDKLQYKKRIVTSAIISHAPAKKIEKVLATRAVDITGLIQVKLNRKTIIWVKPGADINKIKQQYSCTLK